MATLTSKRKRDVSDVPAARAAQPIPTGGHDFDMGYSHADDVGMDNPDTNMDFAAVLAQHNADTNAVAEHQQPNAPPQAPPQQDQGGDASASDTAAAAMAQYHTMTVPLSTEQAFLAQSNPAAATDNQATPGNEQATTSAQRRTSSFADFDVSTAEQDQTSPNGDTSPTAAAGIANAFGNKPAVGTDEWHKVRRDNHKEVERRRRETINEGINELAKIVPGCEKNKGSILGRAVQFITQLKENETQNIEKWTLEKLLTEQAIAELSSSCDKLKAECQRAWAECEQWKKMAQKAGMSIDDDAKADADAEDAE